MVPKLQETILFGTKRIALLVHCIVPRVPIFPQNPRDLTYHLAREHSVTRHSKAYKCKLRHADFPGFYALRQQKNTQHGTQIEFGASNIDVEKKVEDIEGQSLRELLESCKPFLTDTEMENGRQRVFNFAMSSVDILLRGDNLDYVFKELKCALIVTLNLGWF